MLEKIDKRAAEICAVELTLVISSITASIWYTYVSFKGVFNPFYAAIIFLTKDKWPFPKNIFELQLMWEKARQNSGLFKNVPLEATFTLLIIGVVTFSICILISQKTLPLLMRNYIKARFGSAYYSICTYQQRQKTIKHNREIRKGNKETKTEQEQQLESLRKAERDHYEKWKEYYKSELTLSEWKAKVLVDKENY